MNNGMIKIITGIRRCGKSYLLFEIFYNYLIENGVDDSHIITLQLDDIINLKYRDPDVLCEYIHSKIIDNKNYYIFNLLKILKMHGTNILCMVECLIY